MNSEQLKNFLFHAITNRLPVLVTGAPGVAKTSIMIEAAKSAKNRVIISHPVIEDPSDLKGIPFPIEGRARFLPIGNFEEILNCPAEPITWIIDDLGQANPSVQASYMQLLLARELNGKKLPDTITFLAATNRRQDKAGVAGILEPVKSRFACIIELEADINTWSAWATKKELAPEVIAFLRFRPDYLCAFKATNDLSQSPIPRTWEFASTWIKLDLDSELLEQALIGSVGVTAASELLSFMRIYQNLPNIDAILKGQSKDISSDLSTRYAITCAIVARCKKGQVENALLYAKELFDCGYAAFGLVLTKDLLNKFSEAKYTTIYIQMLTDYSDSLSGI